jgi:hypothetical protein
MASAFLWLRRDAAHPGDPLRRALLLAAGLLLACAGPRGAEGGGQAAALGGPLESVAFLEGAWEGESEGLRLTERWDAPRAAVMLGTSWTGTTQRTYMFEFLKLEATEAGLVYSAWPQGKGPTQFLLTSVSGGQLAFENPKNDFPSRITYARRQDGGLDVAIEGTVDGKPERKEWILRRSR